MPALAVTRVALVIGNEAYAEAPLSNPANDASAVGKALEELGFTVVRIKDGTRSEMLEALGRARELLSGQNGVGLFYYAGHALQLEWHNYLVPVDAKLRAPRDVATQTVDVQEVLDAFKAAGNRMNIIVLDACRNNPFGATGRGLGLTQMDAPSGTYLAFSTAPGNVAEDGAGDSGNSLFTHYLVRELRLPKSRVEDVFKRVRLQVRQRTEGRQLPWDATSLEDEFYFDSGSLATVSDDPSARAKAFAQEKADWDRIRSTKDVKDLYAFVAKYPTGSISELALAQLEQLQASKVVTQPNRFGEVTRDRRSRDREGDRYEFVVTDGLTGLERGRGSIVIELAGNDEVSAVGKGLPGGRYLRGGFVLKDQGGTYDPPWPTVPGGDDFQVGQTATARSIQTKANGEKQWIDVHSRVVGRETVTVAVGTVNAYKVEIDVIEQSGQRRKITSWIDPDWGLAVKTIFEFRNYRQNQKNQNAPDIRIREMTSRARGS
jgi:uncharacterized caspase-like protein